MIAVLISRLVSRLPGLQSQYWDRYPDSGLQSWYEDWYWDFFHFSIQQFRLESILLKLEFLTRLLLIFLIYVGFYSNMVGSSQLNLIGQQVSLKTPNNGVLSWSMTNRYGTTYNWGCSASYCRLRSLVRKGTADFRYVTVRPFGSLYLSDRLPSLGW